MVASCIIDFIPSTGSWNCLGTLEIISFNPPSMGTAKGKLHGSLSGKAKEKTTEKQLHWKKGSILKGHRVGSMISMESQFNL